MRIEQHRTFALTQHAAKQMQFRGISPDAVQAALRYGRIVWTRGACIYALGRREVAALREAGHRLEAFAGVQVVTCDGRELTAIVTVYRNQNFRVLRVDKRPAYTKGGC